MSIFKKPYLIFAILFGVVFLSSCRTKSEVRREQELERIKGQVKEAQESRVDYEATSEEIRTEITRIANSMEEQAQVQRTQVEELRKEVFTLNQRVQALEQQAVAAKTPPPAPPKPKVSLETMKKAYHEEDYQEAIEQGKLLIKSKTPDSAKIHFLLADSYYVSKDFASAALEYSEFKKSFPKDSNIASAIYKQAVCFKNLGKGKEARLFFQELVDRFPKHALAAKARAELKKSK